MVGGVVVRGGTHKRPAMPKVLSGRLQMQSGLLGQLAEKSFAVKPTDGTLKHYKVTKKSRKGTAGVIIHTHPSVRLSVCVP